MSDDRSLEELREQKLADLQSKVTEETNESDEQQGTPSEPFHITGRADLGETIDEYETLLVEFTAEWCGPCQMIAPILEDVAAETDAAIGKVDIDEYQQLAAEYGVRGVPTLILFKNGDTAERLVGMQDKQTLIRTLSKYDAA